jgi:membrane protein DedA with SNARE-associated domain
MSFDPTHLIFVYGYWAVAVGVGLESMGVPLPGEGILIAAALYAGATHGLDIEWVILAAASGAVAGDSIGFWLGREFGFRLLLRYGRLFGLGEARLKLGQYLFDRHGGTIVFFGRFVMLLRTVAAVMAGANQMAWRRFVLFNATGGIVWASAFGIGAYMLGTSIHHVSSSIRTILLAVAVGALATGLSVLRRHEKRLIAEAERNMPGPLLCPPSFVKSR